MFHGPVAFDQDISNWDISSLTDADEMFLDASLSDRNFSALLAGWGAADRVRQPDVLFGAGSSTYSGTDAEQGYERLVGDGWVITDGMQEQSIEFSAPGALAVGSNATLQATASSGLAVVFTTSTPEVCSVAGTQVTGLAVGDCVVLANQPGASGWNPAPEVSQTIRVLVIPEPLALKCPTGSCAGANLTGVDLSGLDLSGINFAGAKLARANLSGTTLIGANLNRTDLNRANLRSATMTGLQMKKTSLVGTSLVGADLRKAEFVKTSGKGADFNSARLQKATFKKIEMPRASFSSAKLKKASFTKAEIKRAVFYQTNLTKAAFTDVDATGATFTDANLTKATFLRTTLNRADFSGAKRRGTTFTQSPITGAQLRTLTLPTNDGAL